MQYTHESQKVREREKNTQRKTQGERENTGQPQSFFLVWKCQHQRDASLHRWGRAGGSWMFPCCRMNRGPKPNQEQSEIAWWLGGYGLTSYMSWSHMLLVPSGWPCLLHYTVTRVYSGRKILKCYIGSKVLNTEKYSLSIKYFNLACKWQISSYEILIIENSAVLSLSLTAVNGPKTPPAKPNSQHLTSCWRNSLWHASSIKYESVFRVRAHVCVRLCVFGSASRLQTVATGKSRSTLSCILKCVTLRLMRRRLIGLRGIEEWRVSDGLKGI